MQLFLIYIYILLGSSMTRLGKKIKFYNKTKLSTQSAIWLFSRHKNMLINEKNIYIYNFLLWKYLNNHTPTSRGEIQLCRYTILQIDLYFVYLGPGLSTPIVDTSRSSGRINKLT